MTIEGSSESSGDIVIEPPPATLNIHSAVHAVSSDKITLTEQAVVTKEPDIDEDEEDT